MTSSTITAECLIPGGGEPARSGQAIEIAGGKIARVGAGRSPPELPRRLVMPALCNAHDHARVVRASAMGGLEEPLESWLFRLAVIPSVDPWLASAVSYARSALGGVGSVMTHYTRIQGLSDYLTEAGAVIKAARDVGLRIAFAVQLRDRNPLVYGPSDPILAKLSPAARAAVEKRFLRPPLPASEQIALVEALAAAHDGGGVTVQFGPAAVQWCSDALIRAIAERSASSGRRVHMHLLETKYQRIWADREIPGGIVRYLDDVGLLSPRLSLAHCVWATDDELELIAERGATIVVNTSSNLALRAGLAALPRMLARGCRVAMGLDGMALDEDEDALRELRLNYALAKGSGFDSTMSADQALLFATAHGRFAIDGNQDAGKLEPGADADFLETDLDRLESDLLEPGVPPLGLTLARARKSDVIGLTVAGRPVVRDGRLAGLDLPALEQELMAQLKAGLPSTQDLRAAMPELTAILSGHYREHDGCC